MVESLSAGRTSALQAAHLTYAEVGRTRIGPPVNGYRWFERSKPVAGGGTFEQAALVVMTWGVQRRAGLRVAASSDVVEAGAVVEMRFGAGPLVLTIPCRVVYTIDEPDRKGFAYGTLPGHPERGEELFVVDRRLDGRTTFRIAAFSKPATTLAKVGGPVTSSVQTLMTRRYLATLDA